MTPKNTHEDDINHQAYEDVMDLKSPRFPDDETYMRCYRNWLALDPTRFEPY